MLRVVVWLSVLSVQNMFGFDQGLSLSSHTSLDAQSTNTSIDTQQTAALSFPHIFKRDVPTSAVSLESVDGYKFIRPDQPFEFICPENFAVCSVPDLISHNLKMSPDRPRKILVTHAMEGDNFSCCGRTNGLTYRYMIRYKNCESAICKNGGACVEAYDALGTRHYDCHCPYKTRGFDCGERYQGIEWLVALLWAAVLGEVALMVIALCRHK
uniref:EGF-like domain-containing protein n=1 Tax=Ascaris lumbricoides TaxID=6252 RepID=A0A9J2PIA7_ASCLU